MRLLDIVSTVNPTYGGPIEGVKQHARVTHERGHHVDVVSADDPKAPYTAEFPARLHALGPALNAPGIGAYHYAPRLFSWLRAHARDYDAVIVHGLWQYQTFATWSALRNSGVPYYVFAHGMLDPWFKRTFPLKHAKKWLYWRAIEHRVLRDAQAVLFTCEEERLLARESFSLYHANEAVVGYGTVGTGGDPQRQRQAFLANFPSLFGKRLLLFLGRLHPKKGCDDLIEGFARIAQRAPQLQLVMAGPDQVGWQRTLAARALERGIGERVTWTGMLTGEQKWGALRSAEAFILPSHQENFGIAVVEALACGVPVLISDKVNIWREVAAAQAGLVDEDTTDGTAALLRRWLDLSPRARLRMRAASTACFVHHFDLHTVITRLHELLERRAIEHAPAT